MEDIAYSIASEEDYFSIKELLKENGLPYTDIKTHLKNFIVAKHSGNLVGSIGMEYLNGNGLLRSLVVDGRYRKKGIATSLYGKIISLAKKEGISEVYILTTTAEAYFKTLGFAYADRNTLPSSVRNTEEFMSLCPATAVCMVKEI